MDARVHGARASYFPALTNDSTAVHIANQQHIDIPQGALGVYPQIGPIPGTGVSLDQGKSNFGLSQTTLSQPITQFFKTRAGVDANRADAAGARADMRRTENEVAYKVKEVYYGILATERRRDAVDAQIRAAELRITETQNAVVTGVALEVKAAEVRSQIAQAKHVHGQLQDAVMDMKEELADLCGLPVDTELQLSLLDGSGSDPSPEIEAAVDVGSRAQSRNRSRRSSTRKGARSVAGGSRRIHTRDQRVCAAHLSERRAFSLAQQRRGRLPHELDHL